MSLQDLYRAHSARIERMLARMLGASAADAPDLMQDAFLRAYAAELGDRTELSQALLTVTARRLALNAIRNRTRRATDLVGDFEPLGVLSDEDIAAQAEGSQMQASLQRAIERMPPQCRLVFELRKFDGQSHAEIAARMGLSTKTVERHLTKAIRICRDQLTADGHLSAPRGAAPVRAP